MLSWLLFAVTGRLLIFLGMRFHLPEKIEKIEWISQLHMCSLCMGVWIYTALAFFMNVDILNSWLGFQHVPVIGEIVTGCVTSYLVFIFVLGFKDAHLNVTVI
jgi:uncharacterized membrane protein